MPDPQDLKLMQRLAKLALLAAIVPERHWRRVLKARPGAAVEQPYTQKTLATIERAVGADRLAPGWRQRATEEIDLRWQEDTLFVLKDALPGGWRATLRAHGVERVFEALERGTGAVLWVGLQINSRLAWKKALHRAGLRVTHLSRPEHGFGDTPFAVRYLNPLCHRVERRYLAERVVIDTGSETTPVRRLRRALTANQVVSIQDSGQSARTMSVPFLNGQRVFYPGAAALALAAGAPLFPVFPVRGHGNDFDVHVDTPIAPPDNVDGRDAVAHMVGEFARRLESHVLAEPWRWPWLRWSETSPCNR